MQAIGFNEHYGLQTAVFEGRKTMTRRFEKGLENLEEGNFSFNKNKGEIKLYGEKGSVIEVIKSRYKIGEVVAVKQSYKDAGLSEDTIIYHADKDHGGYRMVKVVNEKGWSNKMFVAANLMPHHIRITDIRCERLQDISDEDCLREGVFECIDIDDCEHGYTYRGGYWHRTPREAFAVLIDKVSGKGTWCSNPFVFVYEFERVD